MKAMKFKHSKVITLNILLVVLLFGFTPADKGSKFNFESVEWEEVKQKAKKENKLIYLDFTASWCPPCKWMKKNTFTNAEAAKFFNENFINVLVDVDKERKALVDKYNPRAVPTIIFMDADENVLVREEGGLSPNQLVKYGKSAIKKADQK